MKENLIQFSCDNGCGKFEKVNVDEVPIDKGWFVINSCDMVFPTNKKSAMPYFEFIVSKQMHFCSRSCFSKFVTGHIDKAEKNSSTSYDEPFPTEHKSSNIFSIGR